jgi:DNA-binding GntR family transcriptional regulator
MDDHHVARDPWRGVHDAILESILAGEYAPGSRLVEQHLADRFRTSRGPVRTALQELDRRGFVVSIDRRGTFVRSLSDEDVEEIFSLYALLFGFALRRAASRVGDEDRAWLAEFAARPVPEDPNELFEHGQEFARTVFAIAAHGRAAVLMETLVDQARPLLVSADPRDVGFRDFPAVCDALARGDADAALAASRAGGEHLRNRWYDSAR